MKKYFFLLAFVYTYLIKFQSMLCSRMRGVSRVYEYHHGRVAIPLVNHGTDKSNIGGKVT